MRVLEGFKQTEVGVIPKDWEVCQLGDFQPYVTSGSRGWAAYYAEHGKPFLRITNLTRNSIYLDLSDIRLVSLNDGDGEAARTELKDGDILISITADIGIIGYITENISKPAYINQHISLVRLDQEKVNSLFVSYFLASECIQKHFIALTDAGAKSGMNLSTVRQVNVAIPPTKAEQEAIAAALSDMDALIKGVEKLLEKKRRIKQGAMQELLRPKADWNGKELGECANIIGGGTPSSFNSLFWKGNINWFTPTEVGFSKYLYESKRKITEAGYMNSSAKMLPAGAILLTSRAGIGDLGILMKEGCTNQGFQSLIAKENIDNEFLYYLMGTLKNKLHQNASGSTFLEITPRRLGKIKVSIPSKQEQEKIAAVLSDMDTEIKQLETQRTKYQQLKTGMMQELLTGKKRLV